ncbi:MAG: D-glycerate dehydrogenase [Candidatus Micrarchaeota archaeon]
MAGKPKIFVTRSIPGKAIEELKRNFEVEVRTQESVIEKDELSRRVKGADALLCILTDPVDAGVMDAAGRQLKIISNYGAGYDKIDVNAASERGILVTNTPGALTDTTADLTCGLLIAAARRIVEGDKYMRECRYEGWGPSFFLGQEVFGKTLGIVGMGRIGKAVAKRMHNGFGMKIIYNDKLGPDADADAEFAAVHVQMERLLRESDFISIHTPLNDETSRMVGDKEFALMKPTAVLVNTSRGNVIDQAALARALREKRIWAAALDVYEDEPRCPVELIPLANAIVIPHIGSASEETRAKMSQMAVDALVDFFGGRVPKNSVNAAALKK